jgi:hypothetical protein
MWVSAVGADTTMDLLLDRAGTTAERHQREWKATQLFVRSTDEWPVRDGTPWWIRTTNLLVSNPQKHSSRHIKHKQFAF